MPLEKIKATLMAESIWHGELSHISRDGLTLIVDSRWTLYHNEANELQAIVQVSNDISDRKKAQNALRESETMFHTMVDCTYNWEYWIGPDEKIIYMTPSVENLTGYSAEEFERNPALISAIVFPADTYLWERHLRAQLEAKKDHAPELEMRIVRKNGEVRWVSDASRSVFHETGRYMGRRVTVRDISAQKIAEEQIRDLAYFDPLTHLPNRRLLMDRLGQALISSRRSLQFGALMILDMDHFKSINDTQGHDIGDRLLVEVAIRLRANVRLDDTVSRLGGDEFVLLIEGLGASERSAANEAEIVAEQVRHALKKTYLLNETDMGHYNTASIGVTLFRGVEQSSELLLKQADVALYQAKDAGRDAVRYFNPAMQAAIDTRTSLETALRRGIDQQEFMLYYQPQVDQDGRVMGAEALIRWHDPEKGLVSPLHFIPLAEETGLILPIGQWVLDTACRQLKQWEKDPRCAHMQIAVNVSARQFHQPDFVETVKQTLAATGANPARLKLELTESVVLDKVDIIVMKMRQLIELGISFSLDDFGTGYSSLSYLKQLPLAQVKIDQSFIRDVTEDPNDAAIVRAILAMNHSLRMEVIAEGVETREQRDFLFENGCTAYQGYFFGRPTPIEEWEDFLLAYPLM